MTNFSLSPRKKVLDHKNVFSVQKFSYALIENKTIWLLLCPSFLMKDLTCITDDVRSSICNRVHLICLTFTLGRKMVSLGELRPIDQPCCWTHFSQNSFWRLVVTLTPIMFCSRGGLLDCAMVNCR